MKFKNALISVSDKSHLVEFILPLCQQGMKVVSTGGTAQHLREHLSSHGIDVKDISQLTGFPEVMGGRVKTLHPYVHMGLLSRLGNQGDEQCLKDYNLEPFDLVICNLYPFEDSVVKGVEGWDLIEKIDIGGPSMLRGAAKNFQRVTVVCDPKDYDWISKKPSLDLKDRSRLAAKVFSHVSSYDSLIAQELGTGWGQELSFGGRRTETELRYGENPEQKAVWYRNLADVTGLHTCNILQGKPLSYNNLLDLDAASSLVRQLGDFACVAVKHNNPCGVAMSSESLLLAVKKAINADPVSVFGGILAMNQPVDADVAEFLNSIFLECIIAPDYTHAALTEFGKKKNLRLLKWPAMNDYQKRSEIKSIAGGFLIQDVDSYQSNTTEWSYMNGAQPSPSILRDLIFAEKVVASLKSNAVAIVSQGQTLGLGMGQVNRVDAVQQSIQRMKLNQDSISEKVLASDAFFPFPDSIDLAAQAGISWILQPGGSLKDEEVKAKAMEYGINMVFTGKRHFKH